MDIREFLRDDPKARPLVGTAVVVAAAFWWWLALLVAWAGLVHVVPLWPAGLAYVVDHYLPVAPTPVMRYGSAVGAALPLIVIAVCYTNVGARRRLNGIGRLTAWIAASGFLLGSAGLWAMQAYPVGPGRIDPIGGPEARAVVEWLGGGAIAAFTVFLSALFGIGAEKEAPGKGGNEPKRRRPSRRGGAPQVPTLAPSVVLTALLAGAGFPVDAAQAPGRRIQLEVRTVYAPAPGRHASEAAHWRVRIGENEFRKPPVFVTFGREGPLEHTVIASADIAAEALIVPVKTNIPFYRQQGVFDVQAPYTAPNPAGVREVEHLFMSYTAKQSFPELFRDYGIAYGAVKALRQDGEATELDERNRVRAVYSFLRLFRDLAVNRYLEGDDLVEWSVSWLTEMGAISPRVVRNAIPQDDVPRLLEQVRSQTSHRFQKLYDQIALLKSDQRRYCKLLELARARIEQYPKDDAGRYPGLIDVYGLVVNAMSPCIYSEKLAGRNDPALARRAEAQIRALGVVVEKSSRPSVRAAARRGSSAIRDIF